MNDGYKGTHMKKKLRERGIALVLSLAMMALLAVLSLGLAKSAEQDLLMASIRHDISLTDRMADRVLNTHLISRASEQQRLMAHASGFPEYGKGEGWVRDHLREYGQLPIPYIPFQNNYRRGQQRSVRWPGAYDFYPHGWSIQVGAWGYGPPSDTADSTEAIKPQEVGGLFVYRTGFRATPAEEEIRDTDFGALISWGVLYDYTESFLDPENIDQADERRLDLQGWYGTNSTNGKWTIGPKIGGRYLYYTEDESIKVPINNYRGMNDSSSMVIPLEKLLSNITNSEISITPQEANSVAEAIQDLPLDEQWDSWEHIWNSGVFEGLTGSGEEVEEKARAIKAVLTPFSIPDSESFYNDHNDSNRYCHRYYLGNLSSANVTTLVSNRQPEPFWNDNMTNIRRNGVRSIEWLGQLRSVMPGYSDVQLRHQVAANLIDYSDGDNNATLYPNGADLPQAVGLETAPYISKVEKVLTFRPDPLDPTNTQRGYLESLEYNVTAVDMYGGQAGQDWDVEVELPDFNEFGQGPLKHLIDEQSYYANNQAVYQIKFDATNASQLCGVARDLSAFSNFSWGNLKVTVKKGSVIGDISWVDFDAITNNNTIDTTMLRTAASSNGASKIKHGFYFFDPRANTHMKPENCCLPNQGERYGFGSLLYNAWEIGSKPAFEDSTKVESGQSVPTTGLFRGWQCDFETSTQVTNRLSTAYIRNGAMISLWEMGMIHRGEPWRTLRINMTAPRETDLSDPNKLKDTEFSMYPNPKNENWEYNWSGFYEDGDGRILDQVKTVNLDLIDPIFNPFSNSPFVWQTVMEYFRDMHNGKSTVRYGYNQDNISSRIRVQVNPLKSQGLASLDSYLPTNTKLAGELWAENNPFYYAVAPYQIFGGDALGYIIMSDPASLQSERSQLAKVPFVGAHDPNAPFHEAFRYLGGANGSSNQSRYASPSSRRMRLPQLNQEDGVRGDNNYTNNLPSNLSRLERNLNNMVPRVRRDAALEELCGKLADIMSFRRQFSRMIVSVQNLSPVGSFFSEQLDNWERQGRDDLTENYVKYGLKGRENGKEQWYLIRGEYKQMNIVKYDLVTGELGVIRREIQD